MGSAVAQSLAQPRSCTQMDFSGLSDIKGKKFGFNDISDKVAFVFYEASWCENLSCETVILCVPV